MAFTKGRKSMKTLQKVAVASLVAGTATAAGDASAAVDSFIKIDGIVGSSTFRGEQGAAELTDVEFSASSPTTIGSAGRGVASGKRTFSPIVIQKVLDASSPGLFRAFTEGEHLKSVEIDFVKTGGGAQSGAGGGQSEFLKIELTDVVISSYSFNGPSGAELPTESVSLNFTKIQQTYTLGSLKIDGEAGGRSTTVSYDLATIKGE
jgi:type VI secretion system secreted protein Hcp